MKNGLFFFALALLLVLLPALLLGLSMNLHTRDAEPVPALLAFIGFGIVPNCIPAFVLFLLIAGKKSFSLSAMYANRPVFFASAGAVISVYAVHWWTLREPVEFGLLVHAVAVPFCGVLAIAAGFAAGSFLKRA